MNHFTDKAGFNAIHSQPTWTFLALQPRAKHHPVGAYFTDYEAKEPNLCKKLFVPLTKLAYIFTFTQATELTPIPGGRGRLGRIFYSSTDYLVAPKGQIGAGETGL